MSSKFTNDTLKATLKWAFVHKPKSHQNLKDLGIDAQDSFQVNAYAPRAELEDFLTRNEISLQVMNPSTEQMQDRIKEDDDGTFLVIKRPATNAQGKAATIKVEDAGGNLISEDILIGNGTAANVHVFTYPKSRGKGRVMRLSGITVTNLVEFSSDQTAAADQEATLAAHSRDSGDLEALS